MSLSYFAYHRERLKELHYAGPLMRIIFNK
jgi:hypothetical protein